MRQTKHLDPKASHEKNFFLQKMFFRNIFHFFRHLNISIFAILPIWGCVRPYPVLKNIHNILLDNLIKIVKIWKHEGILFQNRLF